MQFFLLQGIYMESPVDEWLRPSPETVSKLMTVNITIDTEVIYQCQYHKILSLYLD